MHRSADAAQDVNVTDIMVTPSNDVICRPITCDLNDADVTLTCCLHDNEAYVPFDAVERYFEVCCFSYQTSVVGDRDNLIICNISHAL